MKLKLLLGILIITHASNQHAISDELRKTIVQTGKAAELVGTFIATHMALAFVHEAAHVASGRIAISAGAEIVSNSKVSEFGPYDYEHLSPSAKYPQFKNNSINILIEAIGPTVGIASSLAVFKAKHLAMQKGLIDNKQGMCMNAAALIHIAVQSSTFIPSDIFWKDPHGSQILKYINLKK